MVFIAEVFIAESVDEAVFQVFFGRRPVILFVGTLPALKQLRSRRLVRFAGTPRPRWAGGRTARLAHYDLSLMNVDLVLHECKRGAAENNLDRQNFRTP